MAVDAELSADRDEESVDPSEAISFFGDDLSSAECTSQDEDASADAAALVAVDAKFPVDWDEKSVDSFEIGAVLDGDMSSASSSITGDPVDGAEGGICLSLVHIKAEVIF